MNMPNGISRLQLLGTAKGKRVRKATQAISAGIAYVKNPSEHDIMKLTMREVAKMQGLPTGFYPIAPSELLKLRMSKADEERSLREALELQQLRAKDITENMRISDDERKLAKFAERFMK